MAAQVGNLQVRVGADIRGLQTGMMQAQRAVANSARAMKAQTNDLRLSFQEVATASSRAWRVFLGGAAILGTARAVINLTDAFKNVQAQLRLATAEYGNFTQAQRDVQGIAERSRSDLQATAELYASIQRNAGELGASQAQVARVTETVSKAFKISGATADEAANATRQLVQAFQSGRLMGDEFRSLMENAPRLTRALADSLGVTVGELRNLSKEGKLTADTLIRAFSDAQFTKPIDDEFAQLPVTFDQAMTEVYNAAVITFGEFDRGGQFSTALANFITDGSTGFATLGQAAYDFGATVRGLLDTLDAVRDAFGNLHTEGILGLTGLENATISLRGTMGTLLGVLDGVANKFANLANFPGNVIRQLTGVGGKPIIDPFNMAGTFRRSTQRADLRAITSRGLDPSEWGVGKAPPAFHAPSSGGGGKKAGGGGRKAPEDRSAETEAQFDKDMRQANMEVLRARQDLLHNAEQRSAIEIQLLELERESENAAIDEKVRRAQKDLADKRITQAAFDKVAAEAAILKSKNDEVTRLKTQAVLDEVTHQRAEDAAKLAQTDFELQADALQTQEDLATTASERRDIELRLLDLSYRQEKARLEAVIADEQASEAAKEEARRRLAALNAGYSARVAGVMQRTGGPLEEWARSIPKTTAEIREAIETNIAGALDNAADAAGNLTKEIIGMKGPVADLAAMFVTLLAKMAMFQLLKSAFPSFFGGSSSGLSPDSMTALYGSADGLPNFAGGGSFSILGRRGVDQNMLSLNGIPIANVSYGERLSVDRGAANDVGSAREVTIHQHYTFEGVAITEQQFARGLMATKFDTIHAIREMDRRKA